MADPSLAAVLRSSCVRHTRTLLGAGTLYDFVTDRVTVCTARKRSRAKQARTNNVSSALLADIIHL